MLGDEEHNLDRNQRLPGRGGQTMPVARGGYYGEVGAWAPEEPTGEFRVDLLAYWRLLMSTAC